MVILALSFIFPCGVFLLSLVSRRFCVYFCSAYMVRNMCVKEWSCPPSRTRSSLYFEPLSLVQDYHTFLKADKSRIRPVTSKFEELVTRANKL